MICAAAERMVDRGDRVRMESLAGIRRAGARIYSSRISPSIARPLRDGQD